MKKTLISLPGLTPLGGAAFVGDEALAQLLLDHGAVAQANDRGDLPEDSARLNGHAPRPHGSWNAARHTGRATRKV